MPVQFPSFSGDGDSRSVLATFVLTVRDFLEEIVRSGTDYFGGQLFDRDLHDEMERPFFEIYPEFERAARAVAGLEAAAIAAHGLSGEQLRFKFSVIGHHNDRFRAIGGVTLFRKLIDALDVLLQSLLSALVPAGIGTGIAEIKDYIGLSTTD
ncbi:hypothetical protein RNZ50_17005 [Paracoccaceae bacterium Fryx2]|nr:hypothetical protein [Paracoccaceae bacterium Fryx2]